MLTKKNRVWAAAALLTAAIGFTSCLKNDKITPSRPQAQILFMNVSNSTVPASFYDNDQRISKDTASINFGFISNYSVLGGMHTFQLRKKGGDSVITTNSYNYDSTAYYTYLIVGNNPVRSFTVPSDFTTASQSKINIRCFNLSPGTSSVDFYVGSEKIDSNRAYMSYIDPSSASKFTQFTNFSVNNTITVKKAGTNEILATNNNLTMIQGRSFNIGNVYTIYYAGTPGSTGVDKLVVNAVPSLY